MSFRWLRLPIRSYIIAFALACTLALPYPAASQTPNVSSASLDAATSAYLLNFLRFIEWPETARPTAPTSPYIIGVSGNRLLLDTLIRLVDGQRVRGHPIQIIRIKNINDLLPCHLVYFEPTDSGGEPGVRISEALVAMRAQPTLTVSTAGDFVATGGHIQLFREASSLRFNISDHAQADTGLTINSRLMALSRPLPPSR